MDLRVPAAAASQGDRADTAVRWAVSGVALALFALATATAADPDLWGHVRFGLDLLHSHQLPTSDPYSFTQDVSWVNHEWLSELQMAVAYKIAGPAGLALLKGTLVFSALFLVWSSLTGIHLSTRIVLVGLVAMSTVPLTRTLRPQLWSMLCLAVLCYVLMTDHRTARRWLPLLFAFWANLHGGWIVGLGVLGIWALADGWSDRTRRVEWAIVVGSSAVATGLTPYGWALWRLLWDSVGLSRQITEWQPLWSADPPKWLPWAVTTIATIWAILRTPGRRLHLTGVTVVLAYASLRVMRVWPLYVESAAILLAPAFRERWPSRSALVARSRADIAAAAGIFSVSMAAAAWLLSMSLRCIEVEGDWTPDLVAAHALSGARPGRLVVFFDWGEYALWHWGPQLRVSMDGRRETVYSDRRLSEHGAILEGSAAGIATLDTWRAEYAWLPATSVSTKRWLATHGYRIEVETTKSFVAVRADLPPLPASESRPASPRRCFPD